MNLFLHAHGKGLPRLVHIDPAVGVKAVKEAKGAVPVSLYAAS